MKIDAAVSALSSLAHPARLRVFRLLVKLGEQGMCAGDISKKLGIAKPTLSFHLKELTQAGLIDAQKSGRSITYSLRRKGIQQLMCFLTEDCCQGRAELCLPDRSEKDACLSC